jgi:hypothetical protein
MHKSIFIKRSDRRFAEASVPELVRLMSDVISLREKVAQAELTARIYASQSSTSSPEDGHQYTSRSTPAKKHSSSKVKNKPS